MGIFKHQRDCHPPAIMEGLQDGLGLALEWGESF